MERHADMKRRTFLVSSLLAAGFGAHDPAHAQFIHAVTNGTDDPNAGNLLRQFSQDHYVTLASHRSHSSHSSHASHSSGYGSGGHYSHSSHTSHRSGGGGYYDPQPVMAPLPDAMPRTYPTPPPTSTRTAPSPQPLFGPATRASAPPPDGLPVLSGRTARFASIVRRVQIALFAQDLYTGPINGTVGASTRSALRKFQKARGLDVTGTITPATLDALMVSSE